MDLNNEIHKAQEKSRAEGGQGGASKTLRSLLTKLPSGEGNELEREMDSVERIREEPNQPGAKRPEDMSPQELHAVLWRVLSFRDRGMY